MEAARRESGATVQNLKRGCGGLEFLTSAGFVALVDKETLMTGWLGCPYSRRPCLSCPLRKRRSVVTRRRCGLRRPHDPSNQTIATLGMGLGGRHFFCFDRLGQDPACGKHMHNVGIVRIEALGKFVFFGCLFVVHCVLFRPQKEMLFVPFAKFSVLFSIFHQFLSMVRWIEPGVSPDWTLSKNARHE